MTLKKIKELSFDELCDVFGRLYVTENGQSKFDQIIINLNNHKIEHYVYGLMASGRTPKCGDIRLILNSLAYFTFAKAETLCVAILGIQTIWNTNVNTDFHLLCKKDTTSLGIETIIDLHKSKVSITKNIFDRFYETIDGLDQFSKALLFEVAVTKQQSRDYKGAIEEYDNLLSWHANHEQAYFNRGLCKELLNDYSGAFLDFDKTLKLNPRNERAQNGIGTILLHEKKYDDAKLYFLGTLSLLQLRFSDIKDQINFNLGLCCFYTDSFGDAIFFLDKALQINTLFQEAFHIRALSKFKKELFLEAIQDFNRAIEINQNDGAAYYYRGLSNIAVQNREDACSDFQRATELGELAAFEAMVDYCFYCK